MEIEMLLYTVNFSQPILIYKSENVRRKPQTNICTDLSKTFKRNKTSFNLPQHVRKCMHQYLVSRNKFVYLDDFGMTGISFYLASNTVNI